MRVSAFVVSFVCVCVGGVVVGLHCCVCGWLFVVSCGVAVVAVCVKCMYDCCRCVCVGVLLLLFTVWFDPCASMDFLWS